MTRILFIASLHHPETLQQDRAAAQENKQALPLFPNSTNMRFWEKALRNRGYEVDVFWRNLSGFGSRDVSNLKAEVFTNRITPERVLKAIMHRLPYSLNPDLRRRNALLIDHARTFQPDYLWVVGDNRVVHAETLAHLKQELGCKIIYSTGTSPIVFSQPIERAAAELYDLVVVNDYYHGIQWLELGAQKMTCLPISAVDPDFHHPRQLTSDEQQQFACDVTFVGTLLPANLYGQRVTNSGSPHQIFMSVSGVCMMCRKTLSLICGVMRWVIRCCGCYRARRLASMYTGTSCVTGEICERLKQRVWVLFKLRISYPAHSNGSQMANTSSPMMMLMICAKKSPIILAHPEERERIAAAAREHVLQHHTYEHRLTQLERDLP